MNRYLLNNGFVFLISPIMSLLVACRNVLADLRNIYFVGAFFSVFGAFMPPVSDAYRYRQVYYDTTQFSFDSIDLWNEDKDFLYFWLSSIFNGMGLSFEIFKLVLLLVCYSLYCWMFIDVVKNNDRLYRSKPMLLLSILSLFLSIRFYTLIAGIRFGVASTIVIIAIYLFYKRTFVKAAVVYVLAVAMHFSMLMVLPLIALAFLLTKITISYKIKLLVIAALVIFANSAIGDILLLLFPTNELVEGNVSGYINGMWGTEQMLQSSSFGGMVFTLARILPVIPLGFMVLSQKGSSFINNICFLLVVLLCLMFSSFTLLLRYSNIAIAILFVALLQQLNGSRKSMTKIKVALLSFIIMFGCYTYTQRDSLSRFLLNYRVAISPVTLIIEPTYTDQWVNANLDSDGEYR